MSSAQAKLVENARKSEYEQKTSQLSKTKSDVANARGQQKDLKNKVKGYKDKQDEGDPWATEFKSIQKQVYGMQKEYNTKRCEFEMKQRELTALEDKWEDLKKEAVKPNSEENPLTRGIRALENRLDKAIIKYNEAQSIRKTYEQITKRLKDERITFDNQLAAIEKTLKAKEHDYEELLLLSHDAYHAKEMAQAELHRFEQGVMEERNQRDKEVQEKKALVQQRVEMNQRLEARERMLRQQQDLDRAGELAVKTTSAMAELASSMSHNEAEEEKQRMQDYEEAFRRIKEATGVLDVNEVIQKFLTQEETYNNLFSLSKDNQQKIDALVEEKQRMKQLVDELKYSAAGGAGRRQVGEDLERQLNESTAKCERNSQKYQRCAKVLIDVKAGVDHIAAAVNNIKVDNEAPVEMSDETVEEVLSQCELKLSKLLSLTQTDPQQQKKLKLDQEAHTEKMLAKSQSDIRVRLNDQDNEGDDDDDDDFDDDPDEETWSRKHVKYNSDQIVDRQVKKNRKKGKKAR